MRETIESWGLMISPRASFLPVWLTIHLTLHPVHSATDMFGLTHSAFWSNEFEQPNILHLGTFINGRESLLPVAYLPAWKHAERRSVLLTNSGGLFLLMPRFSSSSLSALICWSLAKSNFQPLLKNVSSSVHSKFQRNLNIFFVYICALDGGHSLFDFLILTRHCCLSLSSTYVGWPKHFIVQRNLIDNKMLGEIQLLLFRILY